MFGKTTVCGWVANPPKSTSNKMPVASVSIAYYTGKRALDGSKESAFINCTLFNTGAEFALKNFEKGDLVYIEGNLVLNRYTDKTGKERESFQVNATYSSILKKKSESVGVSKAPPKKQMRQQEVDTDNFDADYDEIPF